MPKITELDSVISLDGNDVLPIVSKNNNNEDETMKIAVNAIGTKLLNSNEYGALNTTDKKIIGAINEVNTKASQFDNMTATASGAIASFNNGGDDIPVSEFECEIVAQQGSGTPSPSSPLPITGFSQADITVTDNDQITNLYTVSFGQTIYGGRLIYENGQWSIEATFGYIEFDGSNDETWQMYSVTQGNLFRTQSSLKNYLITADNTLCNTYAPTDDRTDLTLSGSGANFDFINNSIANVAGWRTNLSNNPITVCFELETPTIIPITSSTRIKTISGLNNIYSNTGDCEVKYFTNKADSLAELIKAFVL